MSRSSCRAVRIGQFFPFTLLYTCPGKADSGCTGRALNLRSGGVKVSFGNVKLTFGTWGTKVHNSQFTLPLTHTHTRESACVCVYRRGFRFSLSAFSVGFPVIAFAFRTLYETILLQSPEPGGGGFGLDTHLFGFLQESGAGETSLHAFHQRVPVGISPAAHFGGGQEGEDMGGVAVEPLCQ